MHINVSIYMMSQKPAKLKNCFLLFYHAMEGGIICKTESGLTALNPWTYTQTHTSTVGEWIDLPAMLCLIDSPRLVLQDGTIFVGYDVI